MRSVLNWLRDHEEHVRGLHLAAALGGFWRVRSANNEGRVRLESFLAQSADDEAAPDDTAREGA